MPSTVFALAVRLLMARPRTRPPCAACGKPLRKPRHEPPITADGLAPARGDYGDNLVCTPECGWKLALRIVRTVPGVLELLPIEWQPARWGAERGALLARLADRRQRLTDGGFAPAVGENPDPDALRAELADLDHAIGRIRTRSEPP